MLVCFQIKEVSYVYMYIKGLKKKGYSVIGYARKSKGNGTEETRVRMLQLMCGCLRSWLLVNFMFVSYSCNSSDPLYLRDKSQEIALEDGNTQGKINQLKKAFRIITAY